MQVQRYRYVLMYSFFTDLLKHLMLISLESGSFYRKNVGEFSGV